jgi:hypothetical protein
VGASAADAALAFVGATFFWDGGNANETGGLAVVDAAQFWHVDDECARSSGTDARANIRDGEQDFLFLFEVWLGGYDGSDGGVNFTNLLVDLGNAGLGLAL